MVTKEDWRFCNGESLEGLKFTFKKYKPLNNDNDHDHCSFCWAKFSLSIDDALKEGYQTILKSIIWKGEKIEKDEWVCSECFHDFESLLNLQINDQE